MKIDYANSFKRSYRKRIADNSRLKERFIQRMQLFTENPADPTLRTHKLTGKLKNLHSFSVDYDCRIIFEYLSSGHVLLIDIGTHDEVY